MPGTVTRWTVGGSVADRSAEGSSGGTHAAVLTAGVNSQGDTLTQQFFTTVNQVYMLDFDAGIYGVPDSGSTLQLRVEVIGADTRLDETIAPPVAGTNDPALVQFQNYHRIFTANSAVTTLRFTSVGLGNATADQILDTVVVAPGSAPTPTPTPTSTPTPTPTPTTQHQLRLPRQHPVLYR